MLKMMNLIVQSVLEIIENVNYDKPQEKIKLTEKWEEIREKSLELSELQKKLEEVEIVEEDEEGFLLKVDDVEKIKEFEDKKQEVENKITGRKLKPKRSPITKKLKDKDNVIIVDKDKVKSKKRKLL